MQQKKLAWSLVKSVIVELDLKLLFMFIICNIVFSGWINFENLWFKAGTWEGLGASTRNMLYKIGIWLEITSDQVAKKMFGIGNYYYLIWI